MIEEMTVFQHIALVVWFAGLGAILGFFWGMYRDDP